MLRTIRARLIGSYLLVILLAMTVAAALAWRALDRAFLDVLRENLLAQARLVAQTVESGLTSEQAPLVQVLVGPAATVEPSAEEGTPGPLSDASEASGRLPAVADSQTSTVEGADGVAVVGAAALTDTQMYSQASNVLPGYHTRLIDADVLSPTAETSRPSDVAPGRAAQQAAATVETGAENGSQIASQPSEGGAQWLAGDTETGLGRYSQVPNVRPGYHTRVVDEEGTVILGLDEIDSWTSQAGAADGQLASIGEVASKLDLAATGRNRSEPLRDRSEIRSALAGQPATAVRGYSWAPYRRVMYAAYPVRAPDDAVVSVVYIASPLPRLSVSLLPTYFGTQALGGAALALLLAGGAGVVLARSLTRPLNRLTEAAATLSRGGQAPAIPAAPTEELSRLTTAFNRMNANLSAARHTLISRAEEREIILDSLSDGVIAAGGDGEIVLTNGAGAELLRLAPDGVRSAIRDTLDSGLKQATEIAARDRLFELTVSPLKDTAASPIAAVAVAHDVTAARQLDRLRTRFVSDVSHELRTPLTAIKGFIETLREGAAKDRSTRDRFLETIDRETDRLIRMANELLLLARADVGQLVLRRDEVDLGSVVGRAVLQLAGPASAQDITIRQSHEGDPIVVLADADRIQQVLINLLDNAVRHTPSGGAVAVSVRRSGREAMCTVTDTGPGIPREELPHLFERFYRGDRSRVRGASHGGAGLGLSIARALVEAHGGRIWVESEPAQGAAVSFSLPLSA
jgi:two-component system sensor histidine kinase ResE